MADGLRHGCAVLAAAALLAGCGGNSGGSTSTATPTASGPHGKITVVYDPPANGAGAEAKKVLQLGGTNGVAAGFTKSFKLPHNVTIHAVNGFEGPNYNPANRTITLSYGFVEYVAKLLLQHFPQLRTHQSELGAWWAAVNGFILVHERGDALIDLYKIPVLGKEEDAADGLATVFMTRFVNGGSEYAFDAAKFFDALSGRQRKLAPSDYWDEHSLDKQRAYSIVCWIAGANRQNYQAIASAGIIAQDRLRSCPAEYKQRVQSWFELLKPHLRAG